jgi:hypothetical protein
MFALLPLALAVLGAPTLPSACNVFSKAEAQAYVGVTISRVIGEEPEPDEDTGGIHTTCTYLAGKQALVISIEEFPSAPAARKKVTAEYLKSHNSDDEDAPAPTVEPEPGLGDQGYYGQTEHAAMMVMLKGARAYGVILGGAAPKPADRATLRKLVTALAGKI